MGVGGGGGGVLYQAMLSFRCFDTTNKREQALAFGLYEAQAQRDRHGGGLLVCMYFRYTETLPPGEVRVRGGGGGGGGDVGDECLW